MMKITQNTKVLVTGATGYIGRWLVENLVAQHAAVRCLVRTTSDTQHLDELGCDLVVGDVTDQASVSQAVSGMDTVFHVAGVTATLDKRWRSFVNVTGTAHVAQACAKQLSPPRLVYVSSVSAAGPARDDDSEAQSRSARPVSYYGYSKRQGELEIEKVADQLPAVIVRPGIVFGDGNREMLPVFQAIQQLGFHVIPGFYPPRLSLIYIHDLVDILMCASQTRSTLIPGQSGYYVAAIDEHPSYWQLGRLIQQALGSRRVIPIYLPEMTSWLTGIAADLLSRVLRTPTHLSVDKMRDALVSSWEYSTPALREELSFTDSGTLLQQLSRTVSWYREHGWL